MPATRQVSLYRAATAAGFATVWHDESDGIVPMRALPRWFARFARMFR